MDDFENDINRDDAGESGAETNAPDEERTDDLNGASSGNGYPYRPETTYGFFTPRQENGADHTVPSPQYIGGHTSGQEQNVPFTADRQPSDTDSADRQSADPYAAGQQPAHPYNAGQQPADTYAAGQRPADPRTGGANASYPYAGDPYPYRNRRQGYAYPENGDGGKKSSGGKVFGIITGVLCLVLIAALVAVIVSGRKTPVKDPGEANAAVSDEETGKKENADELVTANSPEAPGTVGEKGELSAKDIYKKVLATSVGVLVYNKSDSLASEGSGVLFQTDNDGKYTYIVTCAHVIAGTDGTIMVQTHDEEQYKAEIVGYDNRTDIGVLKIKADGLQLAEIGDSDKLAVGDTVYAIGNPGGVEFANSFTSGMVSALDRPVNSSSSGYTMECIQHTAAINPGNSGGALVNVFGQVIGINSMKIVDDEYEGMGFSVPSSVFVDIVNNIIAHGYVANRPKLGITYVAAQNYNSYGMFVAIKELPKGSIVIYSISKDSSLAGTEAQEGDMIVAVNGKDLDDSSYLPELIENSDVGDVITLSLIRINRDYSYEEFDVRATLVEDRGDTVIEEETTTSRDDYEDYFKDYFGDYFSDYFDDFFH